MRIVTLAEAQEDLQNLADQVGAGRFVKAKSLYLDKVMVTAEDGKPMSAEDLEIHVAPKMSEENEDEEMKAMEEEEDQEEKMEEEEDEKEKRTYKGMSHRKARQKAFAAPVVRRPRSWGTLKNFKDDSNGEAADKALAFGHWLNAQRGVRKSMDFCERKGLHLKSSPHLESVNSHGGFLVPEVFETELISLREEFGVARQRCRVRPMTTDVHRIPRRSATLSPYFVGEASAITESRQTFEQVSLVAKKLSVLTTISSELDEDAFINIADGVAGEIAYAFAKREDECLFLGDGSATYGGIVGLGDSLGSAGLVTTGEMGSDTLAQAQAETTLGMLVDVMAKLPQYADTRNTAWYMHKSTYHNLAQFRALSQGGSTGREVVDGFGQPELFGYPVVFSQVLPDLNTLTDSLNVMYFGDLTQAVSFGDRRSTSIQVSDSAFDVFEQDEIAIRGTERFDINCHDTGDSSEVGPIIGLKLLNDSA
jgi:HK97 family phage major capsid protein